MKDVNYISIEPCLHKECIFTTKLQAKNDYFKKQETYQLIVYSLVVNMHTLWIFVQRRFIDWSTVFASRYLIWQSLPVFLDPWFSCLFKKFRLFKIVIVTFEYYLHKIGYGQLQELLISFYVNNI